MPAPSVYDEGHALGRVHARPDTNIDPRLTMAVHAREGTLDEFMRGFNDGYASVTNNID